MEDLSKLNYGTTATKIVSTNTDSDKTFNGETISTENGIYFADVKGNFISRADFTDKKEKELIEKNYNSHELKEYQKIYMNQLKECFPLLAKNIINYCPDSRERSLALTKLEECMFWANASIARN